MTKKRYAVLYFAVLLLTVSGILFTVASFSKTRRELERQHDAHLYQLVQSTDRNVRNLLVHGMAELQDLVAHRTMREAEAIWRETGDTSALFETLDFNYFLSFDSVSRLIAVSGGEILALDGQKETYTVRSGGDPQKLSLCTDEEGTPFLAFMSPSPEGDICYYALIDYKQFYHNIVGSEVSAGHWVVLYNEENDLFLQNDRFQPVAQLMGSDEALARKDGYSVMVECGRSGEAAIRTYSYEDEADGPESCRIAVIPAGMTENGFFSLAVAEETDAVRSLAVFTTLRLALGLFLIALALVLLSALLIGNRRRNLEAAEKLSLLQQQNETLSEVVEKQATLARHQRLETIGTMASSIAHEFNNLLTPIMGYSIMTMEALGGEKEECIDNLTEIYNAARSAKAIVSQMNQLSRKTDASSFAPLSPDALLQRTMSVADPARAESVTVKTELRCPERCILGNETQLVQLFLNLTLNAFQAMGSLGGELRIVSERKGDRVVVSFADTGPGIPPEVREHIFEPFFTTKEAGKGTGLGLAIAVQICDAHGASIDVESEPGSGAVFRVSFPAESCGDENFSED